MNHIYKLSLLTFVLFAIPSYAADMKFEAKENIMFQGKIATVKTSKKFTKLENCQALCESRNSCVAFTLNKSKGSCTILKNVTGELADTDSISGAKN